MKYPHEDASPKEAAYRVARYGVFGAYLLPVFDQVLDSLSERFNPKIAGVVLGILFAAFVGAGHMNTAHREAIVAEARFSAEPTAQYSHRYAIGHYASKSNRWVGEDHTMFVTPGDAMVHRLWTSLREIFGWTLLIALAAAVIAWWRRGQRDLAGAAYGEGTPEYAEHLFNQSPEGHHQRLYRNDWLVNEVPEEGEAALRRGGGRPTFGRKPEQPGPT
jgi:hypothetical protein